MNKAEMRLKLESQHQDLMSFLKNMKEEQIHIQKDGKWSAIQNVDHLLKSIKVVNSAVHKPSILLRSAFGKPNREARSYEGLVQRYRERLADRTADAPKEYQAADPKELDVPTVLKEYDKEVQRFLKFVKKVKDRKLDGTLLPHPLLGKLLMREILYFMHFHTNHHFEAIKKTQS
ncbi:MAG: DinB family protein [Croceimicrobium sp.]